MREQELTYQVRGAIFDTYNALGPGLLEAVYEEALAYFLTKRFQVSLQGKCYPGDVLTSEEFKPSEMIRGHKIVFRPDPRLKEEVRKEFKLKRISSEAME